MLSRGRDEPGRPGHEVSVPGNLAAVRERIARTGRNPDEITIVAVTKGFDVAVCREAIAAGLNILGENRVHEALTKMDELPDAEWHLIGHLQTNKARVAAGRFALIQSVDSIRLAEALAKIAPAQAVLVEVNVARSTCAASWRWVRHTAIQRPPSSSCESCARKLNSAWERGCPSSPWA